MRIDFNHQYKDRGWHNFAENLNQPRHCWYHFKEGFSNQLVSEAVKQNADGKDKPLTILDPFSGSGTTPLTAALLGHDSISVEVNPFCVFTSRVKCMSGTWNLKRFQMLAAKIIDTAKRNKAQSPLEGKSTFTDGGQNSQWLFNRSVLRAFHRTWKAIETCENSYAGPFKLAAIRSAMNCCNAKKDGKCLRYYTDWRKKDYDQEDFFGSFLSSTTRMVHDVQIASIDSGRKTSIVRGDVRIKLAEVNDKSCNLLVTSPPYLNSFDYSDIYRPELFLGQFIKSNDELRRLRLKTIRSHLQVKWDGELLVNNAMIKAIVDSLRGKTDFWNNRIPSMIEAYFYDMRCVLSEAARILKEGAEAWIVVSTSAYKGVQIPVDLILAELGCEQGFALKEICVLRTLRVAGQQQSEFGNTSLPLRESLIILKR
jgi:hypothetical protein